MRSSRAEVAGFLRLRRFTFREIHEFRNAKSVEDAGTIDPVTLARGTVASCSRIEALRAAQDGPHALSLAQVVALGAMLQRAQNLAGQADLAAHERSLRTSARPLEIPVEALPDLSLRVLPQTWAKPGSTSSFYQRATQDSLRLRRPLALLGS